ncbi:MAG: hypothetical protein ACOCYW_05240 [Roseicyclus sp.]
MLPTAPTPIGPSTSQMQALAAQRPSPTGAEAPAAPKPELGRAAVTEVQASAKAALGIASSRDAIPEIPPDPPPVKGLGVPALDTAKVGDMDEVPTPPETRRMDDLLGALEAPAPNGVDRRV